MKVLLVAVTDRCGQRASMPSRVHNAKHLLVRQKVLGERGVVAFAKVLNVDSFQARVEPWRLRNDLANAVQTNAEIVSPLHRRLGRRAQHGRAPVVGRQLAQGPEARLQIVHREGLRLVENDHRLRQVVQLAAP